MGKIFNFIIIDEFKTKRQGSIYFLTHWHADHYQGICNTWPYGPIYCSRITRKLLLSKYPKLKQVVHQLKYNQQNLIKSYIIDSFGNQQLIQLKVKIYDSNHMAGSIMILFFYEEKYYLHSGDMRFNLAVARNNKDLFRRVQRLNKNIILKEEQQYQCIYKIQKLFLDNTFCDPIFMFPPRSFALKLIINIIEQYSPKKLFLCTDSIGKQQAFIYLSKRFNCKIKINKDRLKYIKCMGIEHSKYFTLQNSWIEVIRKVDKDQKISKNKNSIAITLTGWANLNDYHPIGYNSFVVPYSLHSNYKQIQQFVKFIKPNKIIPIVQHNNQSKSTQFRQKIGSYQSYMFSLCYIKQRGLQYLKKQYQMSRENKQNKGENNKNESQNSQTVFQI